MIRGRNNEYSVVLDACVLAPMPLSDTLLRCAASPALFRVLWSGETLEELRRTLLKFGRSVSQVERRLWVMRESFPEALVHLTPNYLHTAPDLPDPGDRHVAAAAIHADAQAIVTYNLRDFPQHLFEPHGIRVYSPDEFLIRQFHLNTARVLTILDAQANGIRLTRAALLKGLKVGLPKFAALVGTRR